MHRLLSLILALCISSTAVAQFIPCGNYINVGSAPSGNQPGPATISVHISNLSPVLITNHNVYINTFVFVTDNAPVFLGGMIPGHSTQWNAPVTIPAEPIYTYDIRVVAVNTCNSTPCFIDHAVSFVVVNPPTKYLPRAVFVKRK